MILLLKVWVVIIEVIKILVHFLLIWDTLVVYFIKLFHMIIEEILFHQKLQL
jgi:hypothetical protein